MPRRYPVREVIQRLEEVYGRPRFITRFEPMEELVCCILSQNTTDASSFPAFTRLLERYPNWEAVAHAPPEELADVIRKAGLANQKARSIQGALREIHERVGDYSLEPLRGMPLLEARAWLMSLPGVGPKTASIVLCFCFGMGAIPVDTHVFRVSRRLGIIAEGIDEKKAHDSLLQLVPGHLAFRFHNTLIQHGRMTCRAPTPLCERCVVTDRCRYFQSTGPRAGAKLGRPGKSSKTGDGGGIRRS